MNSKHIILTGETTGSVPVKTLKLKLLPTVRSHLVYLYGLLSWPAPAAQRSPPEQCRASVSSPGSVTRGFSSHHRWLSSTRSPPALVWSFKSKRHIIANELNLAYMALHLH